MKSEPPPWPSSSCTTFQALSGCFSGSVPISAIVSSPRWLVAQTGPNFGMDEVGAAAGMRRRASVSTRADQLVFLGVDHRDLVARVGGDQEVALGAVEAAVVQEALGLDVGDLEVR